MSAPTFEQILRRLAECPCMQSEFSAGRPAVTVPLEKKLLMTLWYLGKQKSIRAIRDRIDVPDSTLLNYVRKTMDYITSLNVVQFLTQAQQLDIKKEI